MKEFFASLKTKEGWKRVALSFAYIIPLVIIVDLITKWVMNLSIPHEWIQTASGEYLKSDPVTVIPNFFYFSLEHNPGAAWSFLANLGVWGRIILLTISIVMSGVLLYFYIRKFKTLNTLYRIGLTLMAGGAMGNLIDRAFYWRGLGGPNGVIDFLSFHLWYPSKNGWTYYIFPTFNIADSALVIGSIVLLVAVIIEMIKDAIEKAKKGEYKYSPKELEKMKKEEESSQTVNEENKD